MKITTESSHAEITRQFTITENHPVVPMAHSLNGKKVRISRGAITYRYQGGAWIVKDGYSTDLVGIVLKKDGSDSMNQHSRRAEDHWRSPIADLAGKLADGWQWLAPIIELLRPRGDVAMITTRDHEVSN